MAIQTKELAQIAITAAVAGTTTDIGVLPAGAKHLTIHSNFVYGSGGTSAKFYLQSSADGGDTWFDILCLAHTTSSLRRVVSIDLDAPGTLTTASDGALTDNTKLEGLCGDRLRLKRTTVGTYAGTTTFALSITVR